MIGGNQRFSKQVIVEEKLFTLVDDFEFDGAVCTQNSLRFGIGDLPQGPEPGPEMPKKRVPKII